MNNQGKVTMIVDLQFGSTGKGLIAGHMAETYGYDVVVNANMPNAGHTYINAEGRKWVHKVLPNGIVSSRLKVCMLGPGSVFSYDQLVKEIEGSADLFKARGAVVMIHENAVVLKDSDKASESQIALSIGSTGQGSAAAVVRKMTRNGDDVVIARDWFRQHANFKYEDAIFHTRIHGVNVQVVPANIYRYTLSEARNVLAEGAQGFSLGINEHFYPYTTSRDCTPARFLADMGIAHSDLRDVIGTCRSYPIRVGGNSGGCYDDQHEIEWADIGQEPELTTVTKKQRRIFEFSITQIYEAVDACRPDFIFYNFANYESEDQTAERIQAINNICRKYNKHDSTVGWLGYGPKTTDVVHTSVWKKERYEKMQSNSKVDN